MTKKQEIKLDFHKDTNEAWCASAYFINDKKHTKYAISVAAGPGESAKTAKPYIKERLEDKSKEYLLLNDGARSVESEEYKNFARQLKNSLDKLLNKCYNKIDKDKRRNLYQA